MRLMRSISSNEGTPAASLQDVPVIETLPFRIRLSADTADLHKAVAIRHAAYARHVPDFAAKLSTAEAEDVQPGAVVLLAESKLDGAPLGTMRIQDNSHGPLRVSESVPLPASLANARLAEATRLGIAEGRIGGLVKTALFKAFFFYCLQNDIDWMVITARAPLDRMYERLLFEDVYAGMGFVPIHHVGGMPHRVMQLAVKDVEPSWHRVKHPLTNFFFHTQHPDIDLSLDGDSNALPVHAVAKAMQQGHRAVMA